jgi:hypothetical protein
MTWIFEYRYDDSVSATPIFANLFIYSMTLRTDDPLKESPHSFLHHPRLHETDEYYNDHRYYCR